jgi:hypothetical protein
MATILQRAFLPCILAAGLIVIAWNGGSYDDISRRETFFTVWWLIGLGAAFGLMPRARLSRLTLVAIVGFMALAAWIGLGAIWSDSVGRTLREASRTLGLGGVLLLVVWTFGPRAWRRGVAATTAAAIFICCLAMVSRLTPLTGALEATGYVTKRLNFPFNYWNAVGVWAAMTVGLALAWSAHATRWCIRALALGGVCVAVPVAYLTYSRTAAVGVVIAAATVVALSRHRWLAALNVALAGASSGAVILAIRAHPAISTGTGTRGAAVVAAVLASGIALCTLATFASSRAAVDRTRLSPRATRKVLAVSGAVVVIGVSTVGPALATDAWDSFNRGKEVRATADPARRLTDLSGDRRNLWAAALRAFREQPVTGTGAGTYEFVWNRDPDWTHHVIDAHSLYFEALAEIGLPGALLLVVALGAPLSAALVAPFRQRDAASAGAAAGCAAALLVFCVAAGVDWMWESTAVAVAAVVCGGLVLAAGSHDASGRRIRPRTAGCLLAVIALGLQAPALLSAFEIRASQDAVHDRRLADAVDAATVAITAQPWNIDGYFQRALVLEQFGFLDAAARDARRATEKESQNAEAWLIRARIDVERHKVDAAIAAAERARALNPRNPVFAPARTP